MQLPRVSLSLTPLSDPNFVQVVTNFGVSFQADAVNFEYLSSCCGASLDFDHGEVHICGSCFKSLGPLPEAAVRCQHDDQDGLFFLVYYWLGKALGLVEGQMAARALARLMEIVNVETVCDLLTWGIEPSRHRVEAYLRQFSNVALGETVFDLRPRGIDP